MAPTLKDGIMNVAHKICQAIHEEGGTPFFVGGCVRDQLLGLNPKDFDVEVFNIRPNKLKSILEQFGTICEVGQSFGVVKLRTNEGEIDFSTPRRENKEGRGHKGFIAELDPTMSVAEAASRRDFTINSIYKDAITGEIHDYYRGQVHLGLRMLVPVSNHFSEDPLRVLRGMQFASRFGMVPESKLIAIALPLMTEYKDLAVERVAEEWRKWTKGVFPLYGIRYLISTRWIQLYPELVAMMDVPQDVSWHPEGPVLDHVMYVCNAMANICDREGVTGENREVLMFAALTHDMGKPSTTIFEREKWRSPGHDVAGVPIARKFLKSIGIFDRTIERVLPLISEHMYPFWDLSQITKRTIQRLKIRLGPASLDDLLLLIEADRSGRPPIPPQKCENEELIRNLVADMPPKIQPILTGRHIIEHGVTDGKTIGRLKREAFEYQLDGKFHSLQDALEWLKNQHS